MDSAVIQFPSPRLTFNKLRDEIAALEIDGRVPARIICTQSDLDALMEQAGMLVPDLRRVGTAEVLGLPVEVVPFQTGNHVIDTATAAKVAERRRENYDA